MPTMRTPGRRRMSAVAALGAATALLVTGVSTTGAQALIEPVVESAFFGQQGLDDVDTRAGDVAPTSAQLSAVRGLGATARWNDFGTPQSLINYGGYMGGNGSGNAVYAARAWLRGHRSLFRMTWQQVNQLELVNDSRMAQSKGHAVLFRQQFGGLPAAVDGMVTVGVKDGKISYVSSSIAPTTQQAPAATLNATDAWQRAAADVGRNVPDAAISGVHVDNRTGFTVFKVNGFAQEQQVRLRSLPSPNGSVRRVFEANVVDVKGGAALAYTSYVDARNGAVIVRHNQVDNSMYNEVFQGSITATTCGTNGPFTVDAQTQSIVVTASTAIATNDIVLNLRFGGPNGTIVASFDSGTSPETVTYMPQGGVPAGDYYVEVCPFDDPTVPFTEPGNYAGTFTASEQSAPQGVPYPPAWKYFLANPVLNFSSTNTTDNRKIGCWVQVNMNPACDNPPTPLNNLAARGPWDYNFRTNTPTFTTEGNAAVTAEAWTTPLTPGAIGQRPTSPDRHYGFGNQGTQDFKDIWNNRKCDPTTLTPGGNDILASVTSLFASHNRLHDWSYFLGFTEANYNLQDSNFGNQAMGGVSPNGGEGDPEVGNVQAGAISGGSPSYLGRDNANQITLQDGVPGITNQYLFQPIAGAFYAPCTDGDYDMTVVGHEYNHAISNRMVGGPDANLTGFQAGSMGESWGDQVALEYLFEHNYSTGAGPAVEGPYVTGNKQTGIRNYALDKNPLQYGDLGYDLTGPEVHADGEPWSAVKWDIRQALINKYNGKYPVGNKALQRRCSEGNQDNAAPSAPLAAQFCPGNRRYMQLLIDAYLLQPPASSMLDARDAYLAADRMRFNGANQAVLWKEFANNGFGQFAQTAGTEDDNPKPDYNSPFANEGTLRIGAVNGDSASQPAVKGTLYVGRYEARVTPVADTFNSNGDLPNQIKMVPGTYQFLFQADGFGLSRFNATVRAGQLTDRVIHLSKNVASKSNGATIDGASPGTVNATKLIDDTESTNYAATGQTPSVDVTHPVINVDLAGNQPVPVRSVKVSAMLRPPDKAQDENPNMPDEDSKSRFTALRDFAIATCTESPTSDCSSILPADTPGSPYSVIYNSRTGKQTGQAAFDSTLPRPLAPDLLFQRFDVSDTMATHVRLISLENQCTGAPEYAGEQDNDPLNFTDCKSASSRDESVRAAELEVFSFDESTRGPGDPVVASTMTAPATVKPGEQIQYTISYTNAGPKPSEGATITDKLPQGVQFNSASNGATYNSATRTVKWNLGTVPVNFTGTVKLTVRVPSTTPVGTVVFNQSQFAGKLTFSPPAAAVTTVSPL